VDFLRSRQWRTGRRVLLLVAVLVIGYRNYGDAIATWVRSPGPSDDIVITHTEFRPDLEGDPRPAWFIGLANRSTGTVYDNIVLEATYSDGTVVLERDELVIRQRLDPGQEELVGSRDSRERVGAVRGWLRVLDAEVVE
jgi:hypothetical protein